MLLRARTAYGRSVTLVLIAALAVLAWILTVSLGNALMPGMGSMPGMKHTSGMMNMPGMASMPGMTAESQPAISSTWLGDVGLFLVSWVLMTVAMMLPSTMSMVDTFGRLASSRPGAPSRIASFVLGYVLAWTGVGLLAYLVYLALQTGTDQSTWLADHKGVLAGGALIFAGLYQFTPLKRRCLSKCRSPLGFLMSHWSEGRFGALRMGSHHGIFCIGCCWVLMLLMLAVGMAQLGWMLGLALLMFVEKVVRRGDVIGYGVGVLFLPWGLATAANAVGVFNV